MVNIWMLLLQGYLIWKMTFVMQAYSQDSALNTIQQYPTSTVTSKSTLDGALGAQTEEISHTKVTYSSQKSRAASTSLESSNKHGSTTSGVSNASEAYNKIFNIVKVVEEYCMMLLS